MNRRLSLCALALIVLVGSTGCGRRLEGEADSLAAIRKTERGPRGIAYEEVLADGTTTRVDLLVTDDYRYKAQVSVDGQPALDVIVRDDALAVRVIDVDAAAEAVGEAVAAATSGGASGIPGLPQIPQAPATEASDSTSDGGDGAGGATSPPTSEVIQALETRNWVIDPTGAPELFSATAGKVLEEGEGGIIAPVLEALRSLQATENAIRQAREVKRFNEENLEYDRRADTFPKPESGSTVLRYDLFPQGLPNPNQGIGSAQETLPDEHHFRRMSIYLDGGEVAQVLEAIEINPRLLDDIEGRYDIALPLDEEERAAQIAVEELNALRLAAGLDPIEPKLVSVEILEVDGTEAILLPDTGVAGNLKSLVQVKAAEASSAGPAAQP